MQTSLIYLVSQLERRQSDTFSVAAPRTTAVRAFEDHDQAITFCSEFNNSPRATADGCVRTYVLERIALVWAGKPIGHWIHGGTLCGASLNSRNYSVEHPHQITCAVCKERLAAKYN